MKLLEGKTIAEEIKASLKKDINNFNQQPVLASVRLGDNSSVESYVRAQQKCAQELGIDYKLKSLSTQTTQEQLIESIIEFNRNKNINGIIIQLPLPEHIDVRGIYLAVSPGKDVESMHPENLGKLFFPQETIAPCTATAVMELLKSINFKLYGKEVVVVGHSMILGKPLSIMLLNNYATTTVCHIATYKAEHLIEHIKQADVLVVAVGKANFIKQDWVKKDAVVIDVGINSLNGKITGDVDFESVSKKASFITPVPGGVGPLTSAILMRNLVRLAKRK